MTTIVADARIGVMVSDSIAVDDRDYVHAWPEKVIRSGAREYSALLGYTGRLTDCMLFEKWFRAGAHYTDRPDLREDADVEALVLDKSGITYYDTRFVGIEIHEDFAALGSGEHLALGALHAGATAEEAVEIATCYDSNTGGEVMIHHLNRSKEGEA